MSTEIESPREETDSPTHSSFSSSPPDIPTEIVSDEEMSLIESAFSFAFAASRSSSSSLSTSTSAQIHRSARSITSITLLSKRSFSISSQKLSSSVSDIEDGIGIGSTHKKKKGNESLLRRFRKKKGLAVTDITATEWCEKQKEFFLLHGKPEASKAMKAGSARHAVLEEEVIKRVKIPITSAEEAWALKMMNFIHGTNQLLFDGLTRELPVIGFVEGICMVGVIDEIRMTITTETKRVPQLVETKTRWLDTLPSEPQQRNGRLQLMCYKHLWDNLVADPFPCMQFLELFSLNPNYILSKEIQENATQAGFPVQTLNDVIKYYQSTCSMLPETHNQLLLRYEYQKDQSQIGVDEFLYDCDWVKHRIRSSLEFWKGEREASYTPEDERWKCKYCRYASICPINTTPEVTTQTTKEP